MDDSQAYQKYKQHRKWFNKLYVSERLGYDCGPAGVAPTESRYYIVRPIYNLSGMGLGAEFKYIKAGDYSQVPPGYFWCEIFLGKHFSVTYEFEHNTLPRWNPISSFEGVRMGNELWRFTKWERSNYFPEVPRIFNELSGVGRINVEFKGDKVIEVHLRESPDPDYDAIIPIWKDRKSDIDKYTKIGYTYIESFDDADGFLKIPRLGFMIK